MSDKVLIKYIDAKQASRRIARITLNKPKALNALDLDMVNAMLKHLDNIAKDESVAAVLLDSEGDKAFCAGGDIVSMYKAMAENTSKISAVDLCETLERDSTLSELQTPAFLQDFFTQEYRLDYLIHRFSKPIVVWGNGIIMGGGLGLYAASHIKIATESARIAMPEITIGLFPDVGGSYFLNRLAPGVGLFLGLTAASLNAQDNLALGLSDAIIAHERKASFIEQLSELDELSHQSIQKYAKDFAAGAFTSGSDESFSQSLRPALMPDLLKKLSALDNTRSLDEAVSVLQALPTLVNEEASSAAFKYVNKAVASFNQGSPITAHLVFEQLKRAKDFSLAEVFQMELSMAFTCGALGEFQEGVRALLIDKDNQPKWHFASVAEVPSALIEAHFSRLPGRHQSSYSMDENNDEKTKQHPLANLEGEIL